MTDEPEFAAGMIVEFLHSVDRLLRGIEAAIRVDDRAECVRHAHALRGIAQNLGADSLADLALGLECWGETTDDRAGPELLRECVAGFSRLDAFLRSLYGTDGATLHQQTGGIVAEPGRILVIDDNEAVHDDFRTILGDEPGSVDPEFDRLDQLMGGPPTDPVGRGRFQVDFARQGREGLERIRQAAEENAPYAVVFIDVQMPPGWDGIETSRRVWELQPDTEIVICTAYSTHGWEDILAALGESDQLQFLRKPFDPVSVQQMALALSRKWRLSRMISGQVTELEDRVRQRTRHLRAFVEELKARNAELAEAKQIAEQAVASQRSFVACVSHEFRTPLNGILGAAQLLGETHLEPDQAMLVDIARSSGEVLRELIDDVLDTARIDARRMELEDLAVPIRNLVLETCRSCQLAATNKGLGMFLLIAPEVPDELRGDPTRIRQILINLIGNAVKYTERGRIVVRVSASEEDLCLTVEDTGIGIPAEMHDRVFDAFTRIDGSNTCQHGGTGLGLNIAKRLVQMMKGTVTLQSEPGRGSSFEVRLPLRGPQSHAHPIPDRRVVIATRNELRRQALVHEATRMGLSFKTSDPDDLDESDRAADAVITDMDIPPERATDARWVLCAEARPNPGGSPRLPGLFGGADLVRVLDLQAPASAKAQEAAPLGLRVLVVDDVPVNVVIAKHMVESLGCDAETAADGIEAVERCRTGHFDVILMDYQMPKLDGLEATRLILDEAGATRPAVFAMSADCSDETHSAFEAAGIRGFLAKPISKELLAEALAGVRVATTCRTGSER